MAKVPDNFPEIVNAMECGSISGMVMLPVRMEREMEHDMVYGMNGSIPEECRR